MKVLLSWLKDYIDINETPEAIAEALTMTGLEVEEIIQPGKKISGVVVGQILTKDKHPDSDKLSLCTVNVGKAEPLQIVCGAQNMKAGDKVPVAMLGAKLPSGFEINRAKIRGIESFGMMCSKRELELSEDHSGLYILPEDFQIGMDIVQALKLDDVVFDISVTANRGDALSHLGIARELSAIFNLPLKREPLYDESGKDSISDYINVQIKNNELCSRYGARLVKNVTIKPSPEWMQNRLEKAGIHPINNVVDITNYILLDIGQPMHAFDYDKLANKTIIVRTAKEGEVITTLDKAEHKLSSNMLVIADAEKPVAIAGVMGGLYSSVTEETKNVLLEGAYFDQVTVRKTAKKLAMQSDSSYRFERGVNIDNCPIALNQAANLLKEIANGEPVRGIADVYPQPQALKQIRVRTKRVNRLLGTSLNISQIETFVMRLKLDAKRDGEDLIVSVPPYRHDLTIEADIIEEVARIYGYNNIPETLPTIPSGVILPTPLEKITKTLKQHLVSCGLHEIITYSFIPANANECFHEKKPIAIQNPLSEEMSVMRTSLKWNMFDAIKRNILNDEYDLKFFEIGHVFHKGNAGIIEEPTRLCIGFCGSENPSDWRRSKEQFAIFYAKGFIQNIFDLLKIKVRFAQSSKSVFHPAKQIDILVGKNSVGEMGQIHPALLDNKKMPKTIFICELDLCKIAESVENVTRMKPIPEYPAIRRDLALVVPISVFYRDINKIIIAEGKNLLEECHLFDVYDGKGIQDGFISLAYSLTFRDLKKTLTDAEIQPLIDKMIARLDKELAVKLR